MVFLFRSSASACRRGAGAATTRSLASLAPSHSLPSTPFVVRPSAQEIQDQALGPRNLEAAVRHVHRDGLVVVEDAVPHGVLDRLNEKMVRDARVLQARGEDGPFNFNQGNLQQSAPPVAEYFWPSIFTNPIATQVTSCVLGPGPRWTFCSANTAMPLATGTPQRQPVHADADFAHPDHPFGLVVNVPLVDMTPANGATELWLGTHAHPLGAAAHEGARGERASGRIRPALLAERARVRGPSQPGVKKGSVVIRDLRMWHAGMPNRSDQVRVMLALIHFAPWFRSRLRLGFAEDVRPILEGLEKEGRLGLDVSAVDWKSRDEALGPGGYLDRPFGNSFDLSPEQ